MKIKIFFGIAGGALIGGYIGLVIGGTFLGNFDIHKQIGIEGYELSTYFGILLGAIAASIWGVKLILKKQSKKKDSN